MTTIEVVELDGGPAARGTEHGRRQRAQIRTCIDIYRLVLGRPDELLLRAALSIQRTVRSFSPAVAVEIEAYHLR